jgi:hypothetical protein
VTARSEPPSPSQAGLRAWAHFGGGPGRERWILPFTAVLASGFIVAALAAAMSWIDWRWVLLGLCAGAVVLPCGLLALRGRLDLFEPLTWFAVMFLLLFVARPAWDLAHENFIYTGRLISPTFTKMLVAGLLAGTGFVIGYLTPAGGSLASRLPRPPRLEPRRLLIWSTLVFAVALGAFASFFVEVHGWHDPAQFFFGQNRIRFQAIAATPEATSKYFLVSIVLMIPAALLFLSIRQSEGAGARIGRIAIWAAVASILAFLLITFPAGQRRYVIGMLGALAVYYFLRRGRRPSVLSVLAIAVVGLVVVSAVRDLRLARDRNTHPDPVQWLPWNAARPLFETQDTGVAPALATEMLVVPSSLHYTYGATTLLGPFVTAVPRQLWSGKPRPPNQEILALLWGGSPCTYGTQCSTFSPFGEPYRDGGLVGVFIFALLFGAFWKTAWLYYLRHRDAGAALVAYATLLPFMITWMRGNFILPAMEAALALGVVVLAAVLCRTRPKDISAVSPDHDPGWAGGKG